jgi:hypothetical protein
LIRAIDQGIFPADFMDLWDEFGVYYEGHLIVELKDYRMAVNGSPEIRHVVLRPTMRSRLVDAQLMNEKNIHDVTDQTALEIESKLLVSWI